jgi:hypothetical protein
LHKLNQLFLQKLTGKLSFPQFRELLAHFACCRLHLENPPRFSSLADPETGTVTIVCTERDREPEFYEFDRLVLGNLMERVLYDLMKKNVDIPDFLGQLQKGELSFLFSDNGMFIQNLDDK